MAEPLGYRVETVPVTACLHHKTAVTGLDDETVLLDPARIDRRAFAGLQVLEVDPAEPEAANVLRVGGEVWIHAGCTRTADVLRGRGYRVAGLDMTEFIKAEAGLTCKSVLFRA
jgi:dimethylargininase